MLYFIVHSRPIEQVMDGSIGSFDTLVPSCGNVVVIMGLPVCGVWVAWLSSARTRYREHGRGTAAHPTLRPSRVRSTGPISDGRKLSGFPAVERRGGGAGRAATLCTGVRVADESLESVLNDGGIGSSSAGAAWAQVGVGRRTESETSATPRQ